MSVVTFMFLLAIYFPFLAVCAPNARADSLQSHVHALDVFEEPARSAIGTRTTLMDAPDAKATKPRTEAEGATMLGPSSSTYGSAQSSTASSNADLSSNQRMPPFKSINLVYEGNLNVSSPTQNQRPTPIPSGSAKNWGSLVGSNLLPYPSQGSPFSNATLPHQGNGTNGPGNNCPPQQTVTLPPVTITLPAQTITVTALSETTTITVTPQTQAQTVTVTVTVTITAGPVAPYPTNVGNPGTGQTAASYNGIGTGQNVAVSNGPSAVQNVSPVNVQMTSQAAIPSNPGGSSQGIIQSNSPNQAGQNASGVSVALTASENVNTHTEANQLPNEYAGVPVASSSSPPFFSIPPSLASQLNSIPIVSPNAARPPILTQVSSMSAASAASAASILNGIPLFSPNPARPPIMTQLSSMSAASAASQTGSSPSSSSPPSEQYSAPFQNATSGSGSAAPSSGGILPGSGPTAAGAAGPTSGPTASPQSPGSLYQINGGIGNATAIPVPAVGTNPSPNVNYTNTIPPVNNGPVHPFTGLPPGPSIPPVPVANTSNAQGPPLSPFSPNAACSINGTITQNITANYATLQPSTSPDDLLSMGLNYTTFTPTTIPSPNHLASPSSSNTKLIAVAPPFLSFTLYSASLSCIADPPPSGNCSIQLSGISGQGSSKASYAVETVYLDGSETKTFAVGRELRPWDEMNDIRLSAEIGGQEVGIAIWGMEYAVVGRC